MATKNTVEIHHRRHGPLQRIGSGRHRETYASICGRFVYKVQHYAHGDYNAIEAKLSARYGFRAGPDGERPARCRLLRNGVLVMERLVRYSRIQYDRDIDVEWDDTTPVPAWAERVTDGTRQWGFTRDGRFVVYDFTDESHVFHHAPLQEYTCAPNPSVAPTP